MQKTPNKIAILGCGWLGLPLAKSLIKKNYVVNGSTTSLEKLVLLKEEKINAFQIILTENGATGNFTNFLNDVEVLIIDIPPKLRNLNENTIAHSFVLKMKHLLTEIEKSEVKKVIFISSTSVFNDEQGWVTENTLPMPNTESGQQLLACENLFLNQNNFESVIIRFGGLIGHNRHPAISMAGKTNLERPNAPINFIHQTDCIKIINAIIQSENKNCWQQIYHGVSTEQPKRIDYYTQKASELKVDLPIFNPNDFNEGKKVISVNLKTYLNIETFEKL